MADPSTLSVKERMQLMKKQQEEVAVKPTAESYVRMTRAPLPSQPSTPPAQAHPTSPPVTESSPVRKAPPPPVRNVGTGLSGQDPAPMQREAASSAANGSMRRKTPPAGSSTPPAQRSTPIPALSRTQRPHSTSGTPPTLRKAMAGGLPPPPTVDLPPIPDISSNAVPPVPTTPRPNFTQPSLPPTYCSPPELASQLTAPDAPPLLYPKGVKEELDTDGPPVLPPRPVELPPPPPGRKTKPPPYKSTSDPVALKDFVGKHKLPQMVRVVAGIYDSMEEKRTMPTDQEFVVYFQKRTKIVRAKPEDYYRIYSIPINSAIKFIPLHKADAKFSKSAWEGDFDNVADVHKLKVLPLAMRVMRDIVDTDGKPLKKGAFLFDIRRKDKGKKKGIRATDHLGQKHIFYENERVFFSSERDQIRMFVYEFVRFVQFPVKVQAFIPHDFEDMIDGAAPTPETMIENFSILTFEKATEETTLVVNMDVANLDDYKNSVKYIMEVPVDLDIEVECVEFCDPKDQEDMLKCVVYSHETLDKGDGADQKTVDNPYFEHSQKLLQSQVDHSYKDATEYDDIEHIYDYISVREWAKRTAFPSDRKEKSPSPPSPSLKKKAMALGSSAMGMVKDVIAETKKKASARDLPLPPTPDDADDKQMKLPSRNPLPHPPKQPGSVTMVPPRNVPPRIVAESVVRPPLPVPDTRRPQYPRQAQRPSVDSDSDDDADEYVEATAFVTSTTKVSPRTPTGGAVGRSPSLQGMLPKPLVKPNAVPERMSYEPMKLGEAEDDDVEYEVVRGEKDERPRRGSRDPTSPSSTMSEEDMKASNRDYLRRLDHVKILQLIDLMDLTKYRNNFIREHIDGEVLVDLQEDELRDLGVQSKIHLLRLSKIINGSTSARKYLEEGNPYGTFG